MGGGAMRAAAKMVGISAAGGGILGMTAEHYSAARKAASVRPVQAASEETKLVANNSDAILQKSSSEMDEWVFPDAEEAVAGERMPRVVFGGVPTLQEAKEATSELSAALENTYLLGPKPVGNDGSVEADCDSDTKACITSQLAVSPSVPAPAIMAFKFLHESTTAQNVVASIACDQNVWNAVLQNEDFQQFLKSQQSHSPCESFADYDGAEEYSTPGFAADYDSENSDSGLVDVIQKVKSSVVDMVSNLSGYMQTLFGATKGGSGLLVNSDGTARMSADAVMNTSFMGLAVMAILVILMKRVTTN